MFRKILVVEDNEISRLMLSGILRGDYQVIEAENGVEALGILRREYTVISAVILDIIMPEMDGFEVLRHMRADKELSQIPVIVATGSTDPATEVKALSLGANDFVTKPYNLAIIKHRLANTIRLRENAALVNSIQRDKLTGLYNREAFFEKATELICSHEAGYYVLACYDIDNFKVINDRYGNEKGDEILKQVAEVFRDGFTSVGGICCRVNADNFAVLYPASFIHSDELADIRKRASILDGSTAPINYSIGRYIVSDLSLSVSAMHDRAVLAGASIKARYDTHIAYYDEAMREQVLREQEIKSEMYNALNEGEFEIWLQPQYNHNTVALIGAEALVRWRHPQKGLVVPSAFISVFEQNGFIYELDKYVWEQTCRCIRRWLDAGIRPLPLSVNVSRYDLYRKDLFNVITSIVAQYNIPIDLFRLEITESAFANDTDILIGIVQKLIDYGFTVEIDDFGSGYSSLNVLKDVPANILKLDMRFLEKSGDINRGGNILESVIRMAKWLGMPVIAEGVETSEQADYLKTIGCYYVQGFLYAKPMSIIDFERLLMANCHEEQMPTLELVENYNNNAFWDPQSMDTLIFNSYVGGACVFEYSDGKLELLRVNHKYAETLLGSDENIESILFINLSDYMDERNRIMMRDNIHHAIDTQEESTCEVVLNDLPGNPGKTFIRSTVRCIARAGDRRLFYSSIYNMTSLRLAEEAERHLSEQLKYILENINGGVTAVTVVDNKVHFIFSNDRYYEQLGYTREQYTSEVDNVFMLIHPDDRTVVVEKTSTASIELKPFTISYRAVRRDGSIVWLQSAVSLTHFSGISEPVQLAVASDITAQVLAEKREKVITSQLKAIIENVHGGVSAAVLVNNIPQYIFVNDEYYDMFGYTQEQWKAELGNGIIGIIHPDDLDMVLAHSAEAEKSGKSFSVDFRARRRDGSYIWVRSNGSVCSIEGYDRPVQLSVYSNITEERESAQRILEASAQLKLLNECAHELLAQLDGKVGIEKVLRNAMDYFGGQRAYVFELDDVGHTLSNSLEVCVDGVSSKMAFLQSIPYAKTTHWFEMLQSDGYISISDTELLIRDYGYEYKFLKKYGISSFITVSLIRDGKTTGFIGIDNPTRSSTQLDFLIAIGDFISAMLTRRDMYARIQTDKSMLETLMDDTPGGFKRVRYKNSRDFHCDYVNSGYCRLMGLDPNKAEEIYRQDVMSGIHPDDVKSVHSSVTSALANGDTFSIKARLRYANSGYRTFLINGRRTHDISGEHTLSMYYSDLSETITLERRREELLDNLPCGAAIFEYENEWFSPVYMNRRYYELVGRVSSGTDNENALIAVHPDDRATLISELTQAICGKDMPGCDVRILSGDGSYHNFHIAGSVERQQNGKYLVYAAYTPISAEAMSYREMIPVALSAMMKASTDYAFVKDVNLRYVSCSKSFVALAGKRDEREIIGKTDYELFHKEFADAYRAEDRQLMETGVSLTDYMARLPQGADGMPRYSKTSKYLLYDSSGNIIGLYGTGSDITHVRETLAQLKLITDSSPCAICTYAVYPTELRLIYVNDGITQLTGYSREIFTSFCANDPYVLIHEDDKVTLIQKVEQLRRGGTAFENVYRLRNAKGEIRWVNMRAVTTEESSGVILVNTVHFDITEQKLVSEAVRLRELEYHMAVTQSGRQIYRYNHTDNTIDMTPEVAELFGLDTRIGNVPNCLIESGVIAPECVSDFLSFYNATKRGDKSGSMLVKRRIGTGEMRWFNAHFSNIFDNDGKPVSALIVFEDVTKEHEAQIGMSLDNTRLMAALETVYPMVASMNLSRNIFTIVCGTDLIGSLDFENQSYDDFINLCAAKMHKQQGEKFVEQFESKSLLESLKNVGDSVRMELRRESRYHETHWFELIALRVRNDYSSDVIGVTLCRSIDDQKLNEDALALSLERSKLELDEKTRYENALDISMPIATLIVRIRDYKLLHSGGTLLADYGYSREELEVILSKCLRGFVLDEDYGTRFKSMCDSSDGPIPYFEQEYRAHKKDGSVVWLFEKGTLVDMQGEYVYIIVAMDITHRKSVEERLRISEEEVSIAMAHMGKMICVYDVVERCLTMPEEYAKAVGIDSVIRNAPYSIYGLGHLSLDYIDAHLSFYESIINGEKSGTGEWYIMKADGSWAWERAEFVSVFDDEGKPIKAILSVEDVTNQHLRDEEAQLAKRNERVLQLVAEHSNRSVIRYDIATKSAHVYADSSVDDAGTYFENIPESAIKSGAVLPESADDIRAMFRDIHEGVPSGNVKLHMCVGDCGPMWVDARYSLIGNPLGKAYSAVISFADITLEHERELTIRRYSSTKNNSASGHTLFFDTNLTMDVIEKADGSIGSVEFSRVGSSHMEVVNYGVARYVEESDRRRVTGFFDRERLLAEFARGNQQLSDDFCVIFPDGQRGWLHADIQLVSDPYSGHIMAYTTLHDATREMLAALEVKKQVETDGMTELYNKVTTESLVREKLGGNRNRPCALLIADLDNLKSINDRHGHDCGDIGIKLFAECLKSQFRRTDIVGRVGGDEFAVFLDGGCGESRLRSIMASFMRKLTMTRFGDERGVNLHSSVGIAIGTIGVDSYESLFKKADIALYHVKRNGKNDYAFYVPEMEQDKYHYDGHVSTILTHSLYVDNDDLTYLLTAVSAMYPLVILSNLSCNSYYMLQYENFTTTTCVESGVYDDLIIVGATTFREDSRASFIDLFSRTKLLEAHELGQRIVSHIGHQCGDDGIFRIIRTDVVLADNGNDGDIMAVAMSRELNGTTGTVNSLTLTSKT